MVAFLLVAALGAMLCWGVGDFLIQRSVWRIGSIETLAFIGAIGTFLLLPFVLNDLSHLTGMGLLLLACLGCVMFTASVLNFEALREGKLSVVDVLLEFELPVTVAMSFFLLGERCSLLQGIGMLLVFLGVVLMALRNVHLSWERGAILALVTGALYGLVNFFTASSSRLISPLMAIWFPWAILFLFSMIYLQLFGRTKKAPFAPHWRLIIAVGVIDTLAWIFYAFALHDGSIGLITAIVESYPAVALSLGVWLNRERLAWHQWLGGLLSIGVSIALALTL